MSGEDPYELSKRLVCDLIDLAKKHKLNPVTFVEFALLESIVSHLGLSLGKKAFEDMVKTIEKHGGYIDPRIADVLQRWPSIRREAKKAVKRFGGIEVR